MGEVVWFSPTRICELSMFLLPYSAVPARGLEREQATMTTLGDQIRLRRLARRLSRAEVARAAGLNYYHYCGIEKNVNRYPRAETVNAICKALGVRVVVVLVEAGS